MWRGGRGGGSPPSPAQIARKLGRRGPRGGGRRFAGQRRAVWIVPARGVEDVQSRRRWRGKVGCEGVGQGPRAQSLKIVEAERGRRLYELPRCPGPSEGRDPRGRRPRDHEAVERAVSDPGQARRRRELPAAPSRRVPGPSRVKARAGGAEIAVVADRALPHRVRTTARLALERLVSARRVRRQPADDVSRGRPSYEALGTRGASSSS